MRHGLRTEPCGMLTFREWQMKKSPGRKEEEQPERQEKQDSVVLWN